MSSIGIYYYFEKEEKGDGENARKRPKPLNPLMYQIHGKVTTKEA